MQTKDIICSDVVKYANRKNIAVREQTYLRLLQKGKMRESFDKLLSRLIDEIEDREYKVADGSGLEGLDRPATLSFKTTLGAVQKP